MKKDRTEAEILEAAKAEAQLWLDNFTLDGKFDAEKIHSELAKREFEGLPCHPIIVPGPEEAAAALEPYRDQLGDLKPQNCVWDYYLMAFYESAYHQLPLKEQTHPFMTHSLFDAFCAGLGHLINLGQLLIGVARPEAHRDENLRVHKEDGAAIKWGSYSAWFWHGIEVPKKWIENKDDCDKDDFTKIDNQELKRAFCESLGWERVLRFLGSRKISSDDWGDLLEAQLEDDDGKPARFADVRCPSTARRYLIRTDPSIKSCKHALARAVNLEPEKYEFEAET